VASARHTDRVDERFLAEIISTVGSSLDLEEVLGAVVRLLSDASAVHACFVYLVERGPERLVLRAASAPYRDFVGTIELERGRGLAWWALEHREPVFVRERALEDPRFAYVAELREEEFQSLVAVPIFGRRGEPAGAITMQTEAPREFTEAEADFLVSSATLVANAIENARLYDEASRRVDELERLTSLAESVAAADTLAELGPIVVDGARELLVAAAAHLYLAEPGGERLTLGWSSPRGAEAPAELGLADLGPELGRRGRRSRVAVALVAGGEMLGALVAEGTRAVDLARAVSSHAAVAVKKIEAIDRLSERNRIKDFLTQLAAGAPVGEGARRLGVDLDAPHLVLAAAPASEPFERALAKHAPGSLFDTRENATRALLRVPPSGLARLVESIRTLRSELAPETRVGISDPCAGAAGYAEAFEEATHALAGTRVLRSKEPLLVYEELGAYKYLLRMSLDSGTRDVHRDAVERLVEYDDSHQTQLLRTLEEFLARRGTISATADALYIHPNTLRQRLRRIMELTGLDLRREDWLMVEIAVKLAALQRALAADSHTSAGQRVS
jgi:GAF domain-containing protein